MQTPRLIYFADPMCSWCYGFSPVITQIRRTFGRALPIQLVMGGLRPGNDKPTTEQAKTELKIHWEHVHEATGLPFDDAVLDRPGFLYDTDPAARAVVRVRREDGEKAVQFLARLHHAFYAEGLDVTKAEVLADPTYDIVVINYDAIPWLVGELGLKQTMYDVLLCDEITRLKRTSSKRFKALKPLLPTFKFRWGLTGTPAANGYIDLFGQIYVLDLGKRLGRFITHFRMKYFHQKAWDAYRFYITDEKAKELTAQIEDLALYVAPEDWLSLPPLLHHTIDVPFPKPLEAKYRFLQEEFILKLDESVVTAANAGVLTSKLRQFTGGAVYASDQPGVYETIHTEKLEALENLVEEMNGQPLMVAYQFDHERIRIEEMLRKRGTMHMSLKGGMTTAQATNVMDTWNSGEAEVLLVQPATAALGLNLQFGGDTICWFTLTYNLEEFIQLNKRLHRQGQTNTVRVFMLALEGTIDQYVAKVLSDKEATQDDLFNSLKLEL